MLPLATRRKKRTAADAAAFDALTSGLLAGLSRAFVTGADLDLLAPLRLIEPGKLPTGKAPKVDRSAIARSLSLANLGYGHPQAAAIAEKLADRETRVVVTGQQTGLLGGPLLSLVKAAAAVRWAEAIEASGKPAVAIFWMATEDHDWAEVAHADFPGAERPSRHTLGDDAQPLAPIGMRTVGASIVAILSQLAEEHPDPGYRTWIGRLATLWRPDARFGEAFARQMVAILGERSPLLVDALHGSLKRAEAPHLAKIIERRHELAHRFAEAETRVLVRGHQLQVEPQPGASPLFLLRSHERRRIEWRGESSFALRGLPGEEPVQSLLDTLRDNPSMVSPGVLARPAIQDAVFGTSLLVVGPGELAYLPQVAPVYELLGLTAPFVALRPQAVVLDRRAATRLSEMNVGVAELLADPEGTKHRLGERSGGGIVSPVKVEIERALDALRAPALALDATLEKPFAKTKETVANALQAFSARVSAAAVRKDEVNAKRFDQIRDQIRPNGKAQERLISSAHFPGRFGAGFGAALLDQIDLDPRKLSIVVPSEGVEPARPPEATKEESASAPLVGAPEGVRG